MKQSESTLPPAMLSIEILVLRTMFRIQVLVLRTMLLILIVGKTQRGESEESGHRNGQEYTLP